MIDTHCHIDDPIYTADLAAVIKRQQDAGVEQILVPGVCLKDMPEVIRVCNLYPDYLHPAIGLHPENVGDNWQQELDDMEALLHQHNFIAIGEIGLDYHFDTTYKEQQKRALARQLQWAVDLDLPVMIHSRDATEDTLNILRSFPTLRGVMHCFSGSNETAREIVKMGFYLGIGGVITFKNSKLREHLYNIPLEQIVLETDAPYMTPVPFRGQPNESRYMVYVMQTLAEVYQLPVSTIENVTNRNAKALFRLK